jgi:hypothetical protein
LIGTIIILQHPLPVPSIVAMIIAHNRKYSMQALRTDLEALSSVIPVPQSDLDTVQIFHPSFPEFIQDRNRSRDHDLHVSSSDAHLRVATACLRLIKSQDIAGLRKCFNDNGTGSEPLRYACTHWISHVMSASVIPLLIEELEQFCERHIFHWIEVLRLHQKSSAAYDGLQQALKWSRVSPCHLLIVDGT